MTNLDDWIRAEAKYADAASEGPWETHDFGHAGDSEPTSIVVHSGQFDWEDLAAGGQSLIASMPWYEQKSMDAEFIARARTTHPAMVKALKSVLFRHRPEPARYYGTDLNPDQEFDCRGCGEGRAYPCGTVRDILDNLPLD